MKALFVPSDNPIHTLRIKVRSNDLNYGAHLGNERFLVFAQEARVEFFLDHGWSENQLASHDVGIIVKEAHVQYLNEAFLADTITIKTWVDQLRGCSCHFKHHFYNENKSENVALIDTKVVFYNYKARKIEKCPQGFVDLINSRR